MKNLNRVFNPRSVAIIGASEREGSVGNGLVKNLTGTGFAGKVFLINPNRPSINGLRTYPKIGAIPERVDLAIIATPAATVPAVAEECCKAGVGGIVIITAGFKEAGEDGELLWEELEAVVRKYNIPVIGPNCLGFIRPSIKLNASFANKMPSSGRVAFVSQSGALATAMLDWSMENKLGFSYFVSIGSMIDVGFNELIDYLGKDTDTSAILLYMESLVGAQEFLSVVRRVAKQKPIIALKVGRSAAGAHAAMSHTGSMTGNDAVFDAAFEELGIIRVDTIEEMLNFFAFLSVSDAPTGEGIAILTNAGGPGVIATDTLEAEKGVLAQLAPATISKLDSVLPAIWSKGNPIDIIGDAPPLRYRQALEICLQDSAVSSVLIIVTPQTMTDPAGVAREILSVESRGKCVVAAMIGGTDISAARPILEASRIPLYETPEEALLCLITLGRYAAQQSKPVVRPSAIPLQIQPKKSEPARIIDMATKQKRSALTEVEAKRVLACYGIASGKSAVAHTKKEAAEYAAKIGFPVVMKILSPDILHKTDVGGVKINIDGKSGAAVAFDEIMRSAKKKAPGARIDGVLVEQMIQKDYELLFGASKDPLFGHVIVFGMGGIAVELYKDTVLRLPPITMEKAAEMIRATKIGTLMGGYRGTKGVDITKIQQMLCLFSQLLVDFPQIKEIDINPLAASLVKGKTQALVLDAKIVLEK